MFSDTSVLISNTGANLYLIKYKGYLPETLRTLQFCLSLCNLCKEMIYCNFISYNTFIKHSNKISDLCNCTQSLPVLRSRILHYFHRFFSDFFFFSDCFEDWADLFLSLYLPCLQCELEMVATSPLCIAGFTEKPKKINRLFRWIDREQFLQSTCDFIQVGRWATPQPLSLPLLKVKGGQNTMERAQGWRYYKDITQQFLDSA